MLLRPATRGRRACSSLTARYDALIASGSLRADSQQRLHDLFSEVQAGAWVGTAAIRPGQPTSPGASRSASAAEKVDQEQQTLLAIVDVLCAAHDYPLAIAHLEQVVATQMSY